MSILYPLMALGMLAVAVPIFLHLRRRDEKNLVEFSTLRFLEDQPLARARPLWPRNWPLLILRLLALTLLVAAFAWPFMEREQTVVVEESRVYILDNTLSHQVDDEFRRARDEIADQLSGQDVRRQIGVVELSSTARVLVRFGDDGAAAAETIRQLEPSAERGSFVDAFRTAGEMLATSLGAERRIVLLSDSQANQWTSGGDSAPFLENIEIELPDPNQRARANLSLADPRARRVVRDGRHWIEAGVVLAARGSADSSNVTVVFRDRGREVARQEIALEAGEADQAGAVFAEWESDPGDWLVGEAVIEGAGDSLAGDDRVVFSLPPLRSGRVELIANSLFLRRALAPEVMLGRWEVRRRDAKRRAEDDSQSLAESLEERDPERPPDVLCVESRALSSSVVRETVREDLSEGRGVILWVDQATPLIAGFLRDLGIELESPQNPPSDPATFRYVFAEHPIFAPFRTAELGNLAEIEFTSYRRLNVREASPIAFAASGDPLIFEVNAGPGRMLVFAFAADRRDTNWPIHPTFIPFLDKAMAYVRGETISTTAYQPGESVVWDLAPGDSAKQVMLTAVDPETLGTLADRPEVIRADVRARKSSFQIPRQAGHYAVRYDDNDAVAAILDVNPSPLESELTYDTEPDAVAAWQSEGGQGAGGERIDRTAAMELTRLEALQQHYWWYLLVAAVVAFLAETIYAARK